MASYYDRSSASYATRRPESHGPPRSDLYYDRNTLVASYPTRADAGYVPHERPPVAREERTYIQSQPPQSQAFASALSSRDSRAMPYERDESWRAPPAYARRGATSPEPSAHVRKSYEYRSPGTSWDDPNRWDKESVYESPDLWRRKDASTSRLRSLLNPTSRSDNKYQEPTNSALQATPTGYDRPYVADFAYDSRPTGYRERAGRYNPESYGPPTVYSPPMDSRWSHSLLPQSENAIPIPIPVSAPSRNQGHSSLTDEYKRSQPRISDVTGSGWNLERRSRHDSLSSPYASGHEYRMQSMATGSVHASPTGYASTVSKLPHHARELSNEDIALREAAYSDTASKKRVIDSRTRYPSYYQDSEMHPHSSNASSTPSVWDPVSYSYVPARPPAPWEPSISPDPEYAPLPGVASSLQHVKPSSNPHISPARRDIASSRVYDDYSNQSHPPSPTKNSRPGVMSLNNIVSPVPTVQQKTGTKPPANLMREEDNMELDLEGGQPPMVRRRLSINHSSPLREPANGSLGYPPTPPSSRRRNLELPSAFEPDAEGDSGERAMSESPEPDVEVDKPVESTENEADKLSISSPPLKPHFPLLRPETGLTEDGLRLLPPRPKAEQKEIYEMLSKAIMVRREWERQTREQRVNPILVDNLMRNEETEAKPSTSTPEDVMKDVRERLLSPPKEEQLLSIRSALASKFAIQQESLAEKQERLRREYFELNEMWLRHCAHLDTLYKTNEINDSMTQGGRVTRRSSQALGDVIRSDLEMEQILASLGNEDMTDPNHLAVRNVATIPDMISVEKGRVDYVFDDTNGKVDDPATFYDPRSGFHDWTPEEEKIFYNKYADHPKQFGIIASFLEHKTSVQCVLYYYIHKKRLIDFRNAANMTTTKRRGKGMRRHGKQKGNALLADVQQADRSRPASRGRRRGRGGAVADVGRPRGAETPPSTAGGEPLDGRLRRRRAAVVAAQKLDLEDSQSVDTDNASVAPPKKRRGRKPRSTVEAASGTAAPGEGKVGEGSDPASTPRRKPTGTATTWSESERDEFVRLLGRHGKDFKRISASLPSKTAQQCLNFYKNHNKEMGLERIASAAATQPHSPSPITPPLSNQNLADDDQQIEDATSGVGVLSLDQNGPILKSAGNSVPPMAALTMQSLTTMNNPVYLPPTIPAIPSLSNVRPASAASVPSLHAFHEPPERPHSAMSQAQYASHPPASAGPDLPKAGLAFVNGLEQNYNPEQLKGQAWLPVPHAA